MQATDWESGVKALCIELGVREDFFSEVASLELDARDELGEAGY